MYVHGVIAILDVNIRLSGCYLFVCIMLKNKVII